MTGILDFKSHLINRIFDIEASQYTNYLLKPDGRRRVLRKKYQGELWNVQGAPLGAAEALGKAAFLRHNIDNNADSKGEEHREITAEKIKDRVAGTLTTTRTNLSGAMGG